MSATTDCAAIPRRSLARRLRWWWLRRRSDAILQALPGRLRLPACFEPGPARRPR